MSAEAPRHKRKLVVSEQRFRLGSNGPEPISPKKVIEEIELDDVETDDSVYEECEEIDETDGEDGDGEVVE